MKAALKIKLLQYLDGRYDRSAGSIWIPLLFIAIVSGFIVAIMLPQLLAHGYRPKQSESRNNVGAMARAQQAFHLEHKHFTTDFVQLGLGIQSKTVNYKYEMIGIPPDKPTIINNLAIPLADGLKAHLSIVGTMMIDGEVVLVSVACESEEPPGKNPIWEGLPIQGGEENIGCDCITVGGQRLKDLSN